MGDKPLVLVVGAGAAGIFAAWNAARHGARVVLLEKTDRIGTKVLISGGGKCNVAHDGPLEDVLKAFRPNEARFIRPACYRLPNTEIVRMMTSRGLEVYTRPDGRVFPVHQTAKDVVAILQGYLSDEGVEVRLETPVTGLRVSPGPPRPSGGEGVGGEGVVGRRVDGVETPKGFLPCRHVVLATGGSSYPKSGTTGDGWPWARDAGHTIVTVRAALAPMHMHLDECPQRPGVAVRDCVLKARVAGRQAAQSIAESSLRTPAESGLRPPGKEVARWRGDLLFTHRGVSGPTVLGISRAVAEVIDGASVNLEVDLRPGEGFEQVSESLRSWCAENPRRSLGAYVDGFVAESLVEEVCRSAGLDPEERGGQAGKKTLNRLVEAMKGWPIGRVKRVDLEKGEVVAGGVSLDEVDPQTMRSLRCEGLYLCGEVLDVAGPVGGYNLQAAFATGFVAGETAALDALSFGEGEGR